MKNAPHHRILLDRRSLDMRRLWTAWSTFAKIPDPSFDRFMTLAQDLADEAVAELGTRAGHVACSTGCLLVRAFREPKSAEAHVEVCITTHKHWRFT